MKTIDAEVVIVGASLAAAACAKRLVDAGVEVVAIERHKLPRHKICSGILSPRGHRFLLENFGPLPREILHDPTWCNGVVFHVPSMLSLVMDFDGGPTPHLHRKFSDHWAIRQSGVEVHEETTFFGLTEYDDHVELQASHRGEPLRYKARWVVGADGPSSKVVRSLYPDYQQQIPWFVVGQKFHEIIECPLDENYFHFWFHPELGHYTWCHIRDGRQIVGVGSKRGDNFDARHLLVQRYLEEKHGVRLGPPLDKEACAENFGPSVVNRYVFGRGRVLVTGQAAGFLNMMAEGMSCALHSGAIAGEALVEARRGRSAVQPVYRNFIQSEVQHCTDQWNPLKIAFGRPHEANPKGALARLPASERRQLVREILAFTKIYGHLNWGRQMIGQALGRALTGRYNAQRWL